MLEARRSCPGGSNQKLYLIAASNVQCGAPIDNALRAECANADEIAWHGMARRQDAVFTLSVSSFESISNIHCRTKPWSQRSWEPGYRMCTIGRK